MPTITLVSGRSIFGLVAVALSLALVTGCTQDIQGLRTPRSAASQTLGIRWHEGFQVSYRWELDQDYSIFADKPMTRTFQGDVALSVLSVDSSGVALIQITIRIDPKYVTSGQQSFELYDLEVGPRGRINSNPKGDFVDLIYFYTVLPLLPPGTPSIGDRWHETYKLPNPEFDNTRDFAVNGQYVRDDGKGLSRAVVIQAHLSAQFNDAAPYDKLYGPPPKEVPQQIEVHQQGVDISDVTYRYDPVRQSLLKSTAKNSVNWAATYTDASNGKDLNLRENYVGTETVTFTRSGS